MSYEEGTHIERPGELEIPNENGSGKPSPPTAALYAIVSLLRRRIT